jgi:hypothetical protein
MSDFETKQGPTSDLIMGDSHNLNLPRISMSNQGRIVCNYCKRDNFKSAQGVTQHLEKSRICQNNANFDLLSQNCGKTEFSPQFEGKERPINDSDFDLFESLIQNKERWLKNHDLDGVKLVIGDHFEDKSDENSDNELKNKDDEFEPNHDLNEGQIASDEINLGQDKPNFENEIPQPDTWIRELDSVITKSRG